MDHDAIADTERAEALARILSPDSLVLDVGANRGQFARQILAVSPCRFICFEPVAAAYDDLVSYAAEQPLIEPVRLGVAMTSGEASFFVSRGDTGSSLLPPVPGQASQWATYDHSETIEVTRLDEFMAARGIDRVDLLKTDCQGTDRQVLESAGDLLHPDHIGALLVELNFHTFYEDQESAASVIDLADQRGYFLAGFFRHVNREGWLWYADGLFLPRRAPYAT